MSSSIHNKTIENYLADILNQGDGHKQHFRLKRKDVTIENLAPGILKLTPSSETTTPPLVLSCGIHGNETAPIEILNDILQDIAKEQLSVKRPSLFIFGHLPAIRAHKRFLDFNLNRLFCGVHKNHPEAQESKRAAELEKVVAEFFNEYGRGHHYDLHTAIRPSHLKRFAVFPTSDNGVPKPAEFDSLKSMGIEGLLVAGGKASTFSAHTHQNHQALGYTLELGKVEPFGKNNREDFLAAENYLRSTLSQGPQPKLTGVIKVYNVDFEMIRDSENYTLHLCEDYANFTPLTEGQPIETNKNGLLKAKKDQAVVFPNSKVVVGQRTGLLVSLTGEF
jgi:succinylglutamate desuccinylase